MAKVYQCDRCGDIFDEDTYKTAGGIISLYKPSGGAFSRNPHIDLCPKCTDAFEAWRNAPVDAHEKLVNMPYHNGEKQAKLMGKMYESFIIDEMPDTREKLEADVREWTEYDCEWEKVANVTTKCEMRDFDDTREKLEADVFNYLMRQIGNEWFAADKLETVRKWLDRQAAITEVECIGRWDARAAIENADLKAEMAELTAMVERDYVPREDYEDLRDEFVWTNAFLHRMGKKCGTEDVPSLVAYVDKLESELDQWNKLATNIELPVSPITQFQPKDNERRIAELEAERDELKVCHKIALEGRDAAMDRAVALQARLEGLAEEVDSLRVQRNATAKRLMDAEKERTRLKDALGRAKGFAEGIGRL